MNVMNNKRHRETIATIDRTFLSLLKEMGKIAKREYTKLF